MDCKDWLRRFVTKSELNKSAVRFHQFRRLGFSWVLL